MEIPLDSNALLNPTESLSALYVSHMPLERHNYHIRDDPVLWADFRCYLQLLPPHAPPAAMNYVQPRHLWGVQLRKTMGPDFRLPEAHVCINNFWYHHLTEAEQCTLCAIM